MYLNELRDPCAGHSSQSLPHPAPMEQQQTISVCGCDIGLAHEESVKFM